MVDIPQVSQFGVGMIKTFEGCRLEAYRDPNGLWTIGWGHLLPLGRDWALLAWEQTTCDAQLVADIETAIDPIHRWIDVPLTQPQLDALASLVFNIGAGNFQTSSVIAELNRKRYRGAGEAFLLWRDHGHASERRRIEKAVWDYGTL